MITLVQNTSVYDVEIDNKNYAVTIIYTAFNDYEDIEILDENGNTVTSEEETKIKEYIEENL